jgi:hypothetical protein
VERGRVGTGLTGPSSFRNRVLFHPCPTLAETPFRRFDPTRRWFPLRGWGRTPPEIGDPALIRRSPALSWSIDRGVGKLWTSSPRLSDRSAWRSLGE